MLLSELFAPGKDSLVICSMMFPRDPGDDRPGPRPGRLGRLPILETPCPVHRPTGPARRRRRARVPGGDLVAVAKSPLSRVLAFAEERGWRRLRLVSSVGNTYNRYHLGETPEGHQRPSSNVFRRDGAVLRHFWGSGLLHAPTEPGQEPRHVGTTEPL